MTLNKMDFNKVTLVSAGVAVALTGCSSTHTEKWNDIDRDVDLGEAAFKDAQSKVAPKERPLSRIIDNYYVDTSPMEIIKEDKNSLPSIFHQKFDFYKQEAVKLNDLAARIYTKTGLTIDYINNEKKISEEELAAIEATVSEGNIEDYASSSPSYFDPKAQAVQEEIIYENTQAEEEEDTIYINHEGTLKQLLDYVSVKKGLKWKYDQTSNKIFVYKYDTRTFTILGFAESIDKETSITTSMNSSSTSDDGSGDASTENEQKITIKAKAEYWENVKASLEGVVSSKGTVTFNDLQGKIIVTDNDFVLSNIGDLVDNLNKDSFREVALKVDIVNITITDKREINSSLDVQGINDKFNLNFGDAIDLANPVNNSISFSDGKTSAMLSMLDTVGKVSLENSIDVVTLNNMPVPIQLTQNRSYIESISVEKNSENSDETKEVEVDIVSEGITMTATPNAIGRNVLLDYSLNLSTIDAIEDAPGDVQVQLPITSTKNFVQRVSIRSGVPRVIATVKRELKSNDSEHPLNENLWFVGGSEGIDNKRDVLMVIVTPYITDLNR